MVKPHGFRSNPGEASSTRIAFFILLGRDRDRPPGGVERAGHRAARGDRRELLPLLRGSVELVQLNQVIDGLGVSSNLDQGALV
jgi:hypothetical protein